MADVDFFLKVKDIKGESKDSKFKDEIDLETWRWSQTNEVARVGTGLGAGKVEMGRLEVTFVANKASPTLLLRCAMGENIPEIEVICRRAGKEQHEYLKVKISQCFVTKYVLEGDPRDPNKSGGKEQSLLPRNRMEFAFGKIEFEVSPLDVDKKGSAVKVGWNVLESKKA